MPSTAMHFHSGLWRFQVPVAFPVPYSFTEYRGRVGQAQDREAGSPGSCTRPVKMHITST